MPVNRESGAEADGLKGLRIGAIPCSIKRATNANKSAAPPPTHPEALPDSERAEQPPLPATPYKPYSEKPGLPELRYEPYAEKPRHEAPYRPYKGI